MPTCRPMIFFVNPFHASPVGELPSRCSEKKQFCSSGMRLSIAVHQTFQKLKALLRLVVSKNFVAFDQHLLSWRSKSFWLWLTHATSKSENILHTLTWTSPGTCARTRRNERLGKSHVVFCIPFAFPWHNLLYKHLGRQIKVKTLSFNQKWKVVFIPRREN